MQLKRRLSVLFLSVAVLTSQTLGTTVWASEEGGQAEQQFRAGDQGKILELSFDGEQSGLTSPGVKVTRNGTLSFSSDEAHDGQSLRFDGNANNYLSITDENGGNLLKGYENLTISYWSRTPYMTGCNWATYLAPDGNGVNGNAPTYLAVSDQTSMRVERYRNGRSAEVTARSTADVWKMVTVVIEEGQTTMYIDGNKRACIKNTNKLSDIVGENGVFYIGRANWGNGEGLTGWLDDYAVYNYAMSAEEVKSIYRSSLGTPEKLLEDALSQIHIPDVVTGNLTLLEETESGVKIAWTSSNESVISTKAVPCETYYNEVNIPAGVVMRQPKNTQVTLTAKLTCGTAVREKTYAVTVKAANTQEEYAGYLYAHFNEHAGTTYDGIQQIFFGISKNGTDWTALNNNQFVAESSVGDHGVRDPYIIRSAEGDKFYLIATDLDIDGYKYPGNWGMMASQGSMGLVIWESEDLVNWSEPRLIDVASEINAGMAWAPEAIYDEATGEYLVFWSSGKTNGKCNYIYVAKTRDFWNFTEPELYSNASNLNDGTPDAQGNPRGNIDASIYKEGDTYYRLIKDESDISIRLQSSKKLLAYGPDLKADDYVSVTWNEDEEKMPNRGALFQRINNEGTITVTDSTGNSVTKPCLEQFAFNYEGPTMFKFNDREEWCILVDEYGRGAAAGSGPARGYIPFVSKNLDQENSVYLPSDDEFIMPDAAKHGTVIPITQKEYDALMSKWGTPKQEGNQTLSNSPVLNYDFETVEGTTVKDTSQAGAVNNGTLQGDAAVVQAEGRGNVLQLNGSGSLAFPQGFFDGLSNMTLSMDVCMSDNSTIFSMGSTVRNKISSYTVTANGVENRDRYWDNLPANKYLNLNLTDQAVTGQITTFNDFGMFQVSSQADQNLKDNWKNIAIVMDEHVMSIYVDKELVAKHEHVRSVEELGSNLTAVLGAAYGSTSGFKGYIDNVKVYGWSAENLDDPEQANQDAADTVTEVLQNLGEIKLDAASKTKIEEARKAYNGLSDIQKSLVTNLSALTEAEAQYARLEQQAAAEQVIALIEAIGEVKYDPSCKGRIEAARNAYNSLTEAQAELVTNLSKLTDAEAAYKNLEDQAAGTVDISRAVISSIPNQNFTGSDVKPNFTVTYNGVKLVSGTDYTAAYQKNKNIGKAEIVITGKGKYTGKTTVYFQITVSKGKIYKAGQYKYKMTNANTSGKGTVTVSGVNSKSLKQIKAADTVTIGGKKFKVTAIGDNAFKGCKKAVSATIGKNVRTIGRQAFMNCSKLKKMTVKAAGLKKVGKNALKGINKKAVIKVPGKQLKKYQKILKGKGQNKQVKITK